jgi:preprotein translocase subunit SecE
VLAFVGAKWREEILEMVTKAEVQESRGDVLKLSVAGLLVAAAVAAFYYFSDESLLYRVLGLLAAVAAGAAIFHQTSRGQSLWKFLQDSRTEVRKVVWPTRVETMQTTMIVAVLVVIVGLFLWLLDMLLSFGFQFLTGLGG